MLEGETIMSGARPYCRACNKTLELDVCHSAAGYYLGTECCGGPYSRETHYFKNSDLAAFALEEFKKTGHLTNAR